MPEKGPHGKYAMTLSYAATERFVLGLDYRPQSDDLTPLASYRLLDETQTRPALIAGASADEFDNEISMTYHLVLSKKLAEFGGVSFSPYIGPMYIQTRDELTMIGGFSARKDIASLMGMWSGEYFHLVGKLDLNDHLSVGVVWWGMKTLGVTTGIRF
ncbi:MAG: hypothetical protein AAF226_08830 [Verrucomicrobiota bacterium]